MNDNELINILKYGSKFRIIPKLNKNIIINEIKAAVDNYIYKISFRFNIHIGNFSEWKCKLINSIQCKMTNTENSYHCTTNIREFSNKIKDIQDEYVIMPEDIASNNFGFVCKRFYATVLISEIDSSSVFD